MLISNAEWSLFLKSAPELVISGVSFFLEYEALLKESLMNVILFPTGASLFDCNLHILINQWITCTHIPTCVIQNSILLLLLLSQL